MMAGGGVASAHDPLDVVQFTPDEMRAAVEAAADWGTYVAVHVYTGPGIRRAVDAGVQVIEHGHLAAEDDIRRMADSGVWLSTQPFVESDHSYSSPDSREKNRRVCQGVENTFAWAVEHGVNIAFGTDQGTVELPGNPAFPVPVNERALAEIADGTGGEFFEAATTDELTAIYTDIGSAVATEEARVLVGSWFSGRAMLLIAIAAALSLVFSNRLP